VRYAIAFLLAAVALTTGAISTYRRLSASIRIGAAATATPAADTLERPVVRQPIHASAAEYSRFELEDRAWRERHAHRYSLAELRARGDGRRSPREQMQDRVFELTRSGRRTDAVAVLERWVGAHPRDAEAILSLARLLNEVGRSDASVARYRQLLGLQGAAR
jgi:Flp pilus assembly protein TadD